MLGRRRVYVVHDDAIRVFTHAGRNQGARFAPSSDGPAPPPPTRASTAAAHEE